MAIAISFNPTTGVQPFEPMVVSITGLTASTAYIATLGTPPGRAFRVELMSDGSGNASFTHVMQGRGAITVNLRPATEWNGTTTAAATATSATS